MFELSTLKQIFFDEVMKHISSNPPRKNKIDITIDINESWIFGATGFVNFGYDENGNFKIWELTIGEAYFQFPDFTAKLDEKYVDELVKYCTE